MKEDTASVRIHSDLVKTLTDGMFKLMTDVAELKALVKEQPTAVNNAIEAGIRKHAELCRKGQGSGMVSWIPAPGKRRRVMTKRNVATALTGFGLAIAVFLKYLFD